jgi:hypothetical protein
MAVSVALQNSPQMPSKPIKWLQMPLALATKVTILQKTTHKQVLVFYVVLQ